MGKKKQFLRIPIALSFFSLCEPPMRFSLILSLILAPSVRANVPSLTAENYASMTEGKAVFIKFFAPWCGHCKNMAAAWEKLALDWVDKPNALVAEVDCTTDEGKALCDVSDVNGFPTIKYGDPEALEDYEGGRDYEELAAFADRILSSGICSPHNVDSCPEDKKIQLDAFLAMSTEELQELIGDQEKKIEEATEKFEKELEALQNRYEEISDEKDDTIAEVKASGLSLMKSVLKSKLRLETANTSDEL